MHAGHSGNMGLRSWYSDVLHQRQARVSESSQHVGEWGGDHVCGLRGGAQRGQHREGV